MERMNPEQPLTETELLRLAGYVEHWYEMAEKHFQFAGKVVSLDEDEIFYFSLGLLPVQKQVCAHLALFSFDGSTRRFILDSLSGDVWHLYRRVCHSLTGQDCSFEAAAAARAADFLQRLEATPVEEFTLPDYPF